MPPTRPTAGARRDRDRAELQRRDDRQPNLQRHCRSWRGFIGSLTTLVDKALVERGKERIVTTHFHQTNNVKRLAWNRTRRTVQGETQSLAFSKGTLGVRRSTS